MAPAPDRTAVRRALADLGPDGFVALVAAVHAAREGVESVERDGGVLVVRGPETRRLLPLPDRPGPFRGPAPVGPASDPVDEVVAQADGDAARATAARRGARYRSPADLVDRIRYGLPGDARRRLLADHLGLDADDAAGRSGVVDRIGRRRALAAVAAALVVVAGLAAGAVPVDPTAGGPADPTMPTPAAVSPAGTADAPAAGPDTDRYPPGVDAGGLTDPAALSRAHAVAAGARRYRWTVVEGRTRAKVDLGTDGPGAVVDAITRSSNATGNVSFRTYSDGSYSYVGITGPNGSRYVRETVRRRAGEGPRYADRAANAVGRYLSSGGTVARVGGDGVALYRLTTTAPPARLADAVTDYAAIALVTRDGFVVALDVSYRSHGRRGTTAVAFRFGYRPYRATENPPWYEAARRSTNGTELVGPGSGE